MKPKRSTKKNTARAATANRNPNSVSALTPSALLDLYARMVLIRRFELAAQECYKKGEMPGFIHLYIGEEACAAGVSPDEPLFLRTLTPFQQPFFLVRTAKFGARGVFLVILLSHRLLFTDNMISIYT